MGGCDPYSGWLAGGGLMCHPNAPAGGCGLGYSQTPGVLGLESLLGWLGPPHPASPAGMHGILLAAAPTPCLEKFTAGVNGYTAAELNDALLTVFGEISANLHPKLSEEARAVASTIFNRNSLILACRAAVKPLKEKIKPAKDRQAQAAARYEDLSGHASKYRPKMGAAAYTAECDKAQAEYRAATRALSEAQRALNDASSALIAAESYVSDADRQKATITLSGIVGNPGQYLGFDKGKRDFAGYAQMSEPDRTRNCKRWEVAKAAVRDLAASPDKRDPYIEFRSNASGKRRLKSGEVRIGGNDFSSTKM